MIDRARESRNPKKVIRVTLMESYGEIGRVPVNLSVTEARRSTPPMKINPQIITRKIPTIQDGIPNAI